MTKTYKTVEDCTRLWVSEFNAIPTMMISELMNVDPDSWSEVTEPSSGAVVFVAGNVGTVETVRDGEVLVHLANGLSFSESTEPGIAFTTSTGSPCTWTEVSAGT